MNNENEKELKKVVSSMHMGNILFKDYINRTKDEKLKKELTTVLNRFENHTNSFKKLARKYEIDNIDKLTLRQEMGIKFQKIKKHQNDFGIITEVLRGLNMGMLGMLDFVYNNKNIDHEFKDYALEVLKDYDLLNERIHKFSLENYC